MTTSAPRSPGEEARRLLVAIGHQWPPRRTEQVELRGICPRTGGVEVVGVTTDAALDSLLARWEARGWNAYFGVNPRRRDAQGGREALSRCVCLHVDVDAVGTDPDAVAARPVWGSDLPSAVVASGGGAHVYLALPEALPWQVVDKLNRGLGAVMSGDKCWDSSRVLRLPGTTNWPDARKLARGRVPVATRLVTARGGVASQATLAALAEVESAMPPVDRTEVAPGFADGLADVPTVDEVARFCDRRSYSTDRVFYTTENNTRSHADFGLALDAYVRGADDAMVARLLWHAPWGKAAERGMAYLRVTMEKAKARAEVLVAALSGDQDALPL